MTYAAMTVVPIIKAAVFSAEDHGALDYILAHYSDFTLKAPEEVWSDWMLVHFNYEKYLVVKEGEVVVVKGTKVKVVSFSEFERTYRVV